MSKLSIDQQTKVMNVLRELDAAAKAMTSAIEKLHNLAKEDFIREPYLAMVAEIAGDKMSPDTLEILVPSLTDLAEVAEDIGISPLSVTSLRWSLKELEENGFCSHSDWETLDSDEDEDEEEL